MSKRIATSQQLTDRLWQLPNCVFRHALSFLVVGHTNTGLGGVPLSGAVSHYFYEALKNSAINIAWWPKTNLPLNTLRHYQHCCELHLVFTPSNTPILDEDFTMPKVKKLVVTYSSRRAVDAHLHTDFLCTLIRRTFRAATLNYLRIRYYHRLFPRGNPKLSDCISFEVMGKMITQEGWSFQLNGLWFTQCSKCGTAHTSYSNTKCNGAFCVCSLSDHALCVACGRKERIRLGYRGGYRCSCEAGPKPNQIRCAGPGIGTPTHQMCAQCVPTCAWGFCRAAESVRS